jgi:hypothetical protein
MNSGDWMALERVKAEVTMINQQTVWKCEQWFGGKIKEQNVFLSEQQARDYARRLAGMSPDLVFKIEPMPIQHVWN